LFSAPLKVLVWVWCRVLSVFVADGEFFLHVGVES
jgi:hypothetical protein